MMNIKKVVKSNKLLYSIAHAGKAVVYWNWGAACEMKFVLQRKLCFAGILKENEKFCEVRRLKNSYNGKRCFIVLTGPSMTLDDLALIQNEVTISVNSIINVLDKTSFRPTFYMIQDKSVLLKLEDKLKTMPLENVYIGIGNLGKKSGSCITIDEIGASKETKGWNYYHLDSAKSWYYVNFEKEKLVPNFSEDCNFCIYDGCTVVYSALQLAMYMGFREIYVLGADCDYSGSVRHIGEYDKETVYSKAEEIQNALFKSYEVAFKYAKKKGIKLYNATRGGKLEVLPRVNLEDVIFDAKRG